MNQIVLKVRVSVKERLCRGLRRCRDAGTRLRYLMILNVIHGKSARQTAQVLNVHHTTVGRVVDKFRQYGEAGLYDGRADNGTDKVDEDYLSRLHCIVSNTPQLYGWRRPTWTRELLVETMVRLTGVRIHVTTMSRALALIKARRGRPKPTVRCPWPKAAKTRRLKHLQQFIATLPRRQRVFYEDEVDIHLNPKIGLDWMTAGQQKQVETPGQNEKRYLAGALDVRSGALVWVEGERKTSYLFLDLLDALRRRYAKEHCLHVILDNYRIHKSEIVKAALGGYLAGKIKLHFLPPYCPDHNKIERLWRDLHDNVTRNHRQPTMTCLMVEVRSYLRRYERRQPMWTTAA
jgi:putative transposase